jgi:hypothetical protein
VGAGKLQSYLHHLSDHPRTFTTQTGLEEIWPSGLNEKFNLKKVKRNKPKTTKISKKNKESRNSCRVKVRGVGVKGMIT